MEKVITIAQWKRALTPIQQGDGWEINQDVVRANQQTSVNTSLAAVPYMARPGVRFVGSSHNRKRMV